MMSIVYGALAILIFQFALGLYAVTLNYLFYATFGPFFDSLAYLNELLNMQYTAHTKGCLAALLDASFQSTVVLPWLIFAPFSKAVPAIRTNGVLIQLVTLVPMQFVLFLYFLRARSLPLAQSLVFSSVFCLIAATFCYNGGLSDFRMDFLQYTLFTTVMAAYLIARQSTGLVWWIVLGIATGMLCLGRATSPVYIVPIFAVLAAADLSADARNWRRIAVRWLVVGLTASALAGWYFVANFDRLYYYYVVWNPDANARLPLSGSSRHMLFVVSHIGSVLLAVLTAVALAIVASAIRQFGIPVLRRLHWRALVFSVVPIGYLVLSGAGLNQFVSIVGCSGVLMFLLDPIEDERPAIGPFTSFGVIALLAIATGANAATGLVDHSPQKGAPWLPRQDGLRQLIDRTLAAGRRDGDSRRPYTYTVAHTGWLNNPGIINTLVYDHGFQFIGNRTVTRDGISLQQVPTVSGVPTAIEWQKSAGSDDDARIQNVIASYAEHVDFLIVPTQDSKLPLHVYTTRFIPELRRRILSSSVWDQVGEPIRISSEERLLLFTNRVRSVRADGL
ncbi:MAG: hypothetical protein WAM17_04045 [Rhodoplanes sp.]